jgi:hypothetical protein
LGPKWTPKSTRVGRPERQYASFAALSLNRGDKI